jgi:beta-galactosidase
MHHDLGPVGAAFDRDFARRQLALLKEMGCDAIRTSHNPPAEALLDLCDEMGIMVMDEAFDMWEGWKGDYAQFFKAWHKRDLTDFICRDRSHPSVVMWSIGNELVEHKDNDPSKAIRIAKELTAIIKANDPTRPVTFGCFRQKPMWNGCQNSVDAFGANYLPFKYAEFLRRNPTVGLVGTETSSTVSSRGEYFFPVVASPIKGENDLIHRRNECRTNMVVGAQMSGYDLWGPHPNDYPPDVEFEHQERNPQVYGEFVWTGFDYLGEPDPCAQSGGRSSYFGIFDLAGIPKDRYWLYKSHWRSNVPSAHILPHWTWPGREGELTPVHVYTSGDEAELFVNGVSKGRKKRGRYEYRFIWDDVRYEPGELRVKTWKAGRDWAEDIVRTASKPVRIERQERKFGRLTFITFALKDKNGELCPNSDRAISFTTRQGTRLLSLCNGDASSRERFNGSSMCTFHGLLVAAVEGPAEGLKCSLSDNDGTKSHKSE